MAGYAVLTIPTNRDAGVTVRAGLIVKERLPDNCGVPESFTVTVPVPGAVAVPLSTPVAVLNERPAGTFAADRMYGSVPPVALTVVVG